MKKQIKYAIYAMLVSVAIMLGNLAYWFQYYNLFSMQKWADSFMKAVDMIFLADLTLFFGSRANTRPAASPSAQRHQQQYWLFSGQWKQGCSKTRNGLS